MIKIGRYRIYFTRYYWLQTHGPTRVKKILFMTVCWAAHPSPSDVDKVQQFPLGTPMEHEGIRYHYGKKTTAHVDRGWNDGKGNS